MLPFPTRPNNATLIATLQQSTATMGHVSPHVLMELTLITLISTVKPAILSAPLARSVQPTALPAPQNISITSRA